MSEKLDKLRASLEKERERRIKINTRMDSIRFSLFVLLRWLGESFLRYSLKGCYTA